MARQTVDQLKQRSDTLKAQSQITDAERITIERIDKLITARLKAEQQISKEIENQSNSAKDYESALTSIEKSLGKGNKLYKESAILMESNFEATKGIAQQLKTSTTISDRQKKSILAINKGYKGTTTSLAGAFAQLVKNKNANVDIKALVDKQIASHTKVIASITKQDAASQSLKQQLEAQLETLKAMGDAGEKAAENIKHMGEASEMFASTGMGKGIDKLLAFSKGVGITGKNGPGSIADITKGIAGKAAGGALGGEAAGGGLGGMLSGVGKYLGPIGIAAGAIYAAAEFFDSGGAAKMAISMAAMTGGDVTTAGKELFKQTKQYREMIADYNYVEPLREQQAREMDMLNYKIGLDKDAFHFEQGLVKDSIQFEMDLRSNAINAETAQRKTLYMTSMADAKSAIGVSEVVLNAMGSSTQAILDTVKNVGTTMGVALKDQIQLTTAAAGMAAVYGSSADDVLKLSNTFRLMGKTSATSGAGMVAGLADFAKKNGMSPAQLYKVMADSQEEILNYSNLTGDAYARQAVQLSNMNTSMSDMLKASNSMVLNYKDSIKAEMNLSAMLGKNVNLSEVRARLMAGDEAGGARALKSSLGGMDIGKMNAFQKQALSQATGMGIDKLMSLTQSTGGGNVEGTLQEKNAVKTGQDIAKGAYDTDIANKKTLLDFEQSKRAAMLLEEQMFRLKGIQNEWKYQQELAKAKTEQDIAMANRNMVKEQMSGQLMSVLGVVGSGLNMRQEGESDSTFNNRVGGNLANSYANGTMTDDDFKKLVLAQASVKAGSAVDMNKLGLSDSFMKQMAKDKADQQAASDAAAKKKADYDKLNAGLSPELIKAYQNYTPGQTDPNYGTTGRSSLSGADKAAGATDAAAKAYLAQAQAIGIVPDKQQTDVNNQNIAKTAEGIDKMTANLNPDGTTKAKAIENDPQTTILGDQLNLMIIMAGFLEAIEQHTSNALDFTDVKIDGTSLNKKLLAVAHKSYGVATSKP